MYGQKEMWIRFGGERQNAFNVIPPFSLVLFGNSAR